MAPQVARMPEHVHQPYTRDDDAFLWANRERPAEEVARFSWELSSLRAVGP